MNKPFKNIKIYIKVLVSSSCNPTHSLVNFLEYTHSILEITGLSEQIYMVWEYVEDGSERTDSHVMRRNGF